ncbi:MAG TPA: sigma-70 family RNA polymerase sigma factor [Verrucomicrobiae bacterium]|nr:sigma-70 family RNA polymerase sigma factor [Verrucomicrobiae bacterium]
MPLHEQPDSDIVRQIQSGDAAAFDELMRRYKHPVVNFVFRMLASAHDADDVAQDVFVRVYQNLDTYRPETKFSTWLFALARNAAIDRLRWRARHQAESIESAPEIMAPSGTAEDVHAREIGDQIAAAVAKLPEDQRTAMILSEYHGMAGAEVAAVMRCSEKSVESRLYRARQTLRSALHHLLE